MTLKLVMLGSGTSSGVPRIGNDWGQCDPAEPRNRRTRVSILVESATTRLLVDTSPDFRAQMLAADVVHLDAVFWTHDHADHCHGIDDLRQIMHHRGTPVPGYGHKATMAALRSRFDYAFDGREGYRATIAGHDLPDEGVTVGDIAVTHVDQPHGFISSSGFRFSCGGRSLAYATDFHEMTDAMVSLYAGVDCLVIDALRERPHPTHAHLALTLEAIARIRPGRAILTHMDNSMDYARLRTMLPEGVEPGYDGLTALI
ncbi:MULTISPECIES: MBL fold metallo-hydrolase [unclassified Sphingobium]|uniref:MBL fold metallo-hydrolase n=1 Tax=unclassified Sphingobium TaxID=2611147 RepID=UPI0022253F2A|nr:MULTISPECIES: MBL fold metallo-hydrolase [unclassified Sphingobium]MCW2394406.1 phosphoribosyl 1,2-cyclic phosphate phosphodiesterase [Sphingobium sp. B8D3B]MCW2417920.1 phosphoribosyl 1,2-cyclic phosphate phosphodiesterase [Sphingobium sp. B8D3C]